MVLALILIHPYRAVKSIKARPRWLAAFLMLASVSILLAVVMHPGLVRDTIAHLPNSALEEEKQLVVRSLDDQLWVRCSFLPIRLLIGWSSFAMLLFYACWLFVGVERFRQKHFLSLVVHAEALMLAGKIVQYLMLLASTGTANLHTTSNPISVGWLLKPAGNLLATEFLNALTPFAFWYLVVLTVGVSAICSFGRFKAFLIVSVIWSLSIAFNLEMLSILSDTLHLQI